jgi:hypothetical protein
MRSETTYVSAYLREADYWWANVCSHIKGMEGKYAPYLWPCVAIWAVDRLLRLARLAALNKSLIRSYLLRRSRDGRRHRYLMADARYDAAANVIRLSVLQQASPLPGTATLRALPQPGPGVHFFLYFPTLWRGFGNHPFTLAGWTPSAELRAVSGAASAAAAAAHNEKHAARVTARTTASSCDAGVGEVLDAKVDDNDDDADTDAKGRLISFMRPYGGLTHHLRCALLAAPGQRKRVAVLVEGAVWRACACAWLPPQPRCVRHAALYCRRQRHRRPARLPAAARRSLPRVRQQHNGRRIGEQQDKERARGVGGAQACVCGARARRRRPAAASSRRRVA